MTNSAGRFKARYIGATLQKALLPLESERFPIEPSTPDRINNVPRQTVHKKKSKNLPRLRNWLSRCCELQ